LSKGVADGAFATILELVQDAKKRVKETNVPDVKRRVDAGEKLLLIDVREDNEWAKGTCQCDALGRGIIERDIEQRIRTPAQADFVLWRRLSLRVGRGKFAKDGLHNVESMDGGWKGWLDAGLPMLRTKRPRFIGIWTVVSDAAATKATQ